VPDDCREVAADLNLNKKNRTYGELVAILTRFGFSEHPRNSGSHRVFSKPGCRLSPSLKASRPMKAAYVRKVVNALLECCDE